MLRTLLARHPRVVLVVWAGDTTRATDILVRRLRYPDSTVSFVRALEDQQRMALFSMMDLILDPFPVGDASVVCNVATIFFFFSCLPHPRHLLEFSCPYNS